MTGPAHKAKTAPWLILSYPALMLLALFLVPLGIMVAVSFFRRLPASFFEPAFVLENYARALEPLFLERALFSLGIAALAAGICVLLAFPFTYFLTRLKKRHQIPWLVFLLAVLALSEVIISFAWSLLLSRTAGVSNLLVWLGLMNEPTSWAPGFTAVLLGLVYIALPYAILMLYPPLSRLEPEIPEAATILGASPAQAFLTIITPITRPALIATFLLVFIFVLGSYVIPQVLGRPQQWTLPVLITDQAIARSNLPLAASLAVVLLLASILITFLTLRLGGRQNE